MKPVRFFLPLLLAAAVPHGAQSADFFGGVPTAPAGAGGKNFAAEVKPLLETYCYKCHGTGKKKGKLALDDFKTPEALLNDQKTWGMVLENLRTGDMPPDDEIGRAHV